MRYATNRQLDEELYRRYLWKILRDNMGLETLYMIICLVDAALYSFGYSEQFACIAINLLIRMVLFQTEDLFTGNSSYIISSLSVLPDSPILRQYTVILQCFLNPIYAFVLLFCVITVMKNPSDILRPMSDILDIFSK